MSRDVQHLAARCLLSLVALAAAVPSPAGASSTSRAVGDRAPHSRVVTYDHGDVLVRRLQLRLRPVGGYLAGRLRITVRNATGRRVRRELRLASCSRGTGLEPDCPTT